MKISKIVNNSNQWTSVSGIAQTGIIINNNKSSESYFLGLEEWNNSEILIKHKLAYLDSFRSVKRTEYFDCINLINYIDRNVFFVGRMKGVKQLDDEEINNIKKNLEIENWLTKIKNDFNNINNNQLKEIPREYFISWNSKKIIAPTNESFIINLTYEKFELFENPINLTQIDKRANNWKRLINLYNSKFDLGTTFSLL